VRAGAILGAGAVMPKFSMAQAKGSDIIKVALIGCGGRGTDAVCDMFGADKNIKLVALADLFEDKLEFAKNKFEKKFGSKPEFKTFWGVSKDRMFAGFDAYKHALACDVDVVILATPAIFRYEHMKAAIEAKKHIFAEKPWAVDIITLRKMYELTALADKMGVNVVSGTQRRHHTGYIEAFKRVKDGQIGEIVGANCAWLSPSYAGQNLIEENLSPEEVRYQLRNFFCFIWTSGDSIVDQMIHNLDICNWFIGKKPQEIVGFGGRNVPDFPMPKYGNRFSHFTVDYGYGEGMHLTAMGKQEPKSTRCIFERIVGTKGVLEMSLHPDTQRIYGEKPWVFDNSAGVNCLELEHATLLNAIRKGERVNMIDDMLASNLMAITGRQAAYSGTKFKYDWTLLKSQERLVPENIEFGLKPIAPCPSTSTYSLI